MNGRAIMNDYFAELQEKAVRKATQKTTEKLVRKFISLGKLPLEEIAQCSGLTLEKVQTLASTL